MKTLLIAEIGHNWVPFGFKSIESLIKLAAKAKWDIVKFQVYDTDKIKQPGDTNYDELKKGELSFEQLKELSEICEENNIEFLASAFDPVRVQWLERLGVKRHKLASRCIHDLATIVSMQETGKQIIASLANYSGPLFPDFKADWLYCKTRRQVLQDGFNHNDLVWAVENSHSGFSDHTVGNTYAKVAMINGAKIVEKHITLDKNAAGWDQPSSADFDDMLEIAKHNGRK